MSCNPSSSHDTGNTQASPPTADNRLSIHVDAEGVVGGDNRKKWSSRCGALIRAIIPISFKDWRQVTIEYKDDLWMALMKEFKLNIPTTVARTILEPSFPQFFRTEKHNIRVEFIRNAASKRDCLANCPDEIDKVWWETFVENEWEDKKIQQCKKNAENKAKNTITHALGRRSYSQVYESMEKANPGAKIKRSAGWKVAYTSQKTGKVVPSAEEKYKQIEAEEEKRKSKSTSEHGSVTSIDDDIEHDELAAVFGPDKNNRCRAMSSTSSMKRVKFGQAVKAIAEEKAATKLSEYQAELKVTVETIIKESMNTAAAMFFGMPKFSQPQSSEGSTPRTEGASNYHIQNQLQPQNLNNAFDAIATPMPSKDSATSNSGKVYVMLLSREQKEVAKGYIFKHSGVCHMRVVAPDERVVFVTEVKDPESIIYEAPQNGHSKLCEIADGGFLIWLQTRLRYL